MSAEQQGRQYGKVSRAVMVLTVLVMLVLVATIVLMPFYGAPVSGPDTENSETNTVPEAGELWTLPETTAPPEPPQ